MYYLVFEGRNSRALGSGRDGFRSADAEHGWKQDEAVEKSKSDNEHEHLRIDNGLLNNVRKEELQSEETLKKVRNTYAFEGNRRANAR